ncbi:MAG: photosystem II protein PsbQ [Prochlorococcaceae cyanobacterium]
MADVAAVGCHPTRQLADQPRSIRTDQLQDRRRGAHATWPTSTACVAPEAPPGEIGRDCKRLQSVSNQPRGRYSHAHARPNPLLTMTAVSTAVLQQLRRLALLLVGAVLCFGLTACGDAKAKTPVLSADDIAIIERQAEGFLEARNRLPELASLVNEKDWTFTRNLIHGPMQEVGREMLYINQHLLPADRAEANKRAENLKSAFAQLDEAAVLQDGDKLRKAYIKVASGFGLYAQMLPPQVQEDLKQL